MSPHHIPYAVSPKDVCRQIHKTALMMHNTPITTCIYDKIVKSLALSSNLFLIGGGFGVSLNGFSRTSILYVNFSLYVQNGTTCTYMYVLLLLSLASGLSY